MRVFVTGASGAIGNRLVPQLIDAGHDVIGTHNSQSSADLLRTLGATPVLLDLLDAHAVRTAVLESEPEAIVHEATALANVKFSRNMDKVTAKTSELRTKGTDALLAAAREAGVRRFVAQSVASFSRYAREGGPVKTEDDPLDPKPPKNFQRSAAAVAYLEQAVTDFGGIALRYGAFYGAANAIEPVRKRQFPIVGDGEASGPGSTSTTLPPQPFSLWNMTARRSTTSSTTIPLRCANGCPCSPRPSTRSRPGASPPGSRGFWQVSP
jgi:nucleoside-diphosphate-sugar epimerase